MHQPATLADNLRGSLFMVVAMAGFTANDLIVKSVGQTLNLGQTLFLRGCFASLGVLILAMALGQVRDPRSILNGGVLLRSFAEGLATIGFVVALFHIPIANVSAIYQTLPLALTLAAMLFLKEQVGIRRLSAIAAGFVGVLIIIRPGMDGFNVYSVAVLASVAASVVRDVVTRGIPRTIPGLMITFVTAITVTMCGLVYSFFEPWNPVTMTELLKLAGTSVFLVIGYFFIILAVRAGDIGFVSPFRYSVLLFSISGGILVYGEIPDSYTIAGSAIIVASGIYMLYRERVVHRQAITPPPQRS